MSTDQEKEKKVLLGLSTAELKEVAKELGIETDTPAQLARYKETWKMKGE